jgi:hypothetical protein
MAAVSFKYMGLEGKTEREKPRERAKNPESGPDNARKF